MNQYLIAGVIYFYLGIFNLWPYIYRIEAIGGYQPSGKKLKKAFTVIFFWPLVLFRIIKIF